jgi:hypothetical protein
LVVSASTSAGHYFFRHLPALDNDADALLMTGRGLLLSGTLFALFCLTLELERWGHALEAPDRAAQHCASQPSALTCFW